MGSKTESLTELAETYYDSSNTPFHHLNDTNWKYILEKNFDRMFYTYVTRQFTIKAVTMPEGYFEFMMELIDIPPGIQNKIRIAFLDPVTPEGYSKKFELYRENSLVL